MPNEPPASVTEGLPTQWSPSPNGPAATPAPDPADYAPVAPMAPTEAAPMNGEPIVLGEGSDILYLQTRTQHSGLDEETKLGLRENGCNK